MTAPLFRTDPYARSCTAQVCGLTETGAVLVDRAVFYPAGGGQPGDSGVIAWPGGRAAVIDTVKAGDAIALVLEPGASPPAPGTAITQTLDWQRRHRHMRMHTALHLLSVVLPLPVTGGAIGADKGRLDFDMPEAPADRDGLEAALNGLVARDLPVSESWITDAELDANPGLVKTMSAQPPRGQGRVRLIAIGEGDERVDLQPCGGTHVARTGEIGALRLGKIEKKGRQNRRVTIWLDDA
ncbi:MAG: Ala-tRNA(Pro) hydrolase [Rhodobacteraceae bacterium HLUCCA12]|nr:MAG: Ala-tRNA(Pro) hydrolase [Rhodobacteraceae bacterium HLUCCA12]